MLPILAVSRDLRKIRSYALSCAKKHKINTLQILHIKPEKEQIKIDQIREVSAFLTRPSKIENLIVIYDFYTAQEAGQNAFLKTLEEKTDKCIIILHVQDPAQVLPTIVSRCRVVNLKTRETEIDNKTLFDPDKPEVAMSEIASISRKKAVELIDQIIFQYRQKLKNNFGHQIREKRNTIVILHECFAVRRYVLRYNVSHQLALDHLIYFLSCQKK